MSENAPTTHQDAILGVSAPTGVSGPTVPAPAAVAVLRDHTPNARRVTHGFVPHAAGTLCMECHGEWQGDATTGGCTARLLATEVVRLRGEVGVLLERLARGERLVYVDAPTSRTALLEGLLGELEWAAQSTLASPGGALRTVRCCALCGGEPAVGHAPACRLAAALAEGDGS